MKITLTVFTILLFSSFSHASIIETGKSGISSIEKPGLVYKIKGRCGTPKK